LSHFILTDYYHVKMVFLTEFLVNNDLSTNMFYISLVKVTNTDLLNTNICV
jgi:hypothetical protein